MNFIITTPISVFLSIATGITCGLLLYFGKYKAINSGNVKQDRLFSFLRYIIFLFFLFTILQLKTTNSILFIVFFLVSYLGTIAFCINKTG